MGSVSTYTDEQRQEALTLYLEVGASEAARRLEMPARTVRYWANQAELATVRTKNLDDAAEMLRATQDRMREELRVRLLEKALDALDRMDQKHIDYRGKDATQVTWEVATSGDMKNYATTAAILLDKYRLEVGESTSRPEMVGLSTVDKELLRTVEEWNRADAAT